MDKPLTNLKVFLLEDAKESARILSMFLEKAGAEVKWQSDPLKALKMLKGSGVDYDFVISDISMPKMDGFEFCSEVIKESNLKFTKFIAVSGYKESELTKNGFDFDVYLEKPINSKKLISKLCEAIH